MRSTVEFGEFDAFEQYANELRSELDSLVASPGQHLAKEIAGPHLDGRSYAQLRRLVSVEARRRAGTFFTGSALRAQLVAPHRDLIAGGAHVLDPACGTGDLLVEASLHLPADWSFARRLAHMSIRFSGRDTVPSLVEVAKDRLRLSALSSAPKPAIRPKVSLDASPLLAIRVGDGVAADTPIERARLILLNPPFSRQSLSSPQPWATGAVSVAAPFIAATVERSSAGTRIAAIIPDVLRAGPRYAKWRAAIEGRAEVVSVKVVGLFDPWTDVDVAMLQLVVRPRSDAVDSPMEGNAWFGGSTPRGLHLNEIAEISVGDVVPHRTEHEGPVVPYLTVQDTPVGATVLATGSRKFSGRLHRAPFVALRRTSAPTRQGQPRLLASVVDRRLGDVAVENHLIIVKPKEATQDECYALAERLTQSDVTAWLNRRVCTRHLTKVALQALPLPTFAPVDKVR